MSVTFRQSTTTLKGARNTAFGFHISSLLYLQHWSFGRDICMSWPTDCLLVVLFFTSSNTEDILFFSTCILKNMAAFKCEYYRLDHTKGSVIRSLSWGLSFTARMGRNRLSSHICQLKCLYKSRHPSVWLLSTSDRVWSALWIYTHAQTHIWHCIA